VGVIVHGRVQGVWFRETVRRAAFAEGVAGWIRNRPDGAVEAVLEGRAEAVERVVEICAAGPPGARVDRIERRDEPPVGDRRFVVRG